MKYLNFLKKKSEQQHVEQRQEFVVFTFSGFNFEGQSK
jgi:hypothetical protein